MSKRNLFAFSLFVAAAVALLVVGVFPVAGQTPVNDDRYSPSIIEALPFNTTQDTTEATQGHDDPYLSCNNYYGRPQATVWFSLTAAESMAIQATTNGSNYNTVLAAFNHWGDQIGCVSGTSSLLIDLQAGETYSFMVGDRSTSPYPVSGGGGTLVFSMEQVPGPANDNFADALVANSVPFHHDVNLAGSTGEVGEPSASCDWNDLGRTIWYAFSPDADGSYSVELRNHTFDAFMAVYTGDSLSNLHEIGCRTSYYNSDLFTLRMAAGTTYYYQVGKLNDWDTAGLIEFNLDVAPEPEVDFSFYPSEASRYEEVHFYSNSYDPANVGFARYIWNFAGEIVESECCLDYRFGDDRQYEVELTAITHDGRSASMTRTVQVETHDIAIIKFQTPNSAKAGQTRQISVGVRNHLYPETATLQLYRSTPNGDEYVGQWTQEIPVRLGNRTTDFSFNYTFTEANAAQGKVTFRVHIDLWNHRDALQADNEAISMPTTVR